MLTRRTLLKLPGAGIGIGMAAAAVPSSAPAPPPPVLPPPPAPAPDRQLLEWSLLRDIAARIPAAVQTHLVTGNLAARSFEARLAAIGDVLRLPVPPVIASHSPARPGSPAEVRLGCHIEAFVMLPAPEQLLARPDLLDHYLRPATINLAEAMEADLLALSLPISYGWPEEASLLHEFNPDPWEGNPCWAEAAIDAAETSLFNAYVPMAVPKFLVAGVDTHSRMRAHLARYREYSDGPREAARLGISRHGLAGEFKGFHVYQSRGGDHCLAFAPDGIVLATRRLAPPDNDALVMYAERDGLGFRLQLTGRLLTIATLYGVGLLRPDFAFRVGV